MSHAAPPVHPLHIAATRDIPAGPPAGPVARVALRVVLGALALLAAAAVLAPARWTAEALVGVGGPELDRVVLGVWLFKGMLLLNAALLWAATRFLPRRAAGEPL